MDFFVLLFCINQAAKTYKMAPLYSFADAFAAFFSSFLLFLCIRLMFLPICRIFAKFH